MRRGNVRQMKETKKPVNNCCVLRYVASQDQSLTDINVFSQHIFACPEPIPKITHCRVSPTRQTCSLNTLVCCFYYFALNTQFVFTRHAYRVHMTEPHLHNHRYKHPHTNIDTLWLKEKLYLTHKHTHTHPGSQLLHTLSLNCRKKYNFSNETFPPISNKHINVTFSMK